MNEALFDDAVLPALAATLLAALLVLYVWGIVRAYRAAGDSWKTMDRDVRLVFLLAVPLFRGGIRVLLLLDRLFYSPRSAAMKLDTDANGDGPPTSIPNN